jgi:hypothetical protein
MSLIAVRRERKQLAPGPSRPPRLWKLLFGLILVGILIWRLSQLS